MFNFCVIFLLERTWLISFISPSPIFLKISKNEWIKEYQYRVSKKQIKQKRENLSQNYQRRESLSHNYQGRKSLNHSYFNCDFENVLSKAKTQKIIIKPEYTDSFRPKEDTLINSISVNGRVWSLSSFSAGNIRSETLWNEPETVFKCRTSKFTAWERFNMLITRNYKQRWDLGY